MRWALAGRTEAQSASAAPRLKPADFQEAVIAISSFENGAGLMPPRQPKPSRLRSSAKQAKQRARKAKGHAKQKGRIAPALSPCRLRGRPLEKLVVLAPAIGLDRSG